MNTLYIQSGYHITTDPQFQNKRYGIPPALEKQLEALGIECQKKSTSKLIVTVIKICKAHEHPLHYWYFVEGEPYRQQTCLIKFLW